MVFLQKVHGSVHRRRVYTDAIVLQVRSKFHFLRNSVTLIEFAARRKIGQRRCSCAANSINVTEISRYDGAALSFRAEDFPGGALRVQPWPEPRVSSCRGCPITLLNGEPVGSMFFV